jgi:hypothetical protein
MCVQTGGSIVGTQQIISCSWTLPFLAPISSAFDVDPDTPRAPIFFFYFNTPPPRLPSSPPPPRSPPAHCWCADCWQSHERTANGQLQPDAAKFPSGMAALAAEVHSKGMKFGVYSDAGSLTCGGYPGSR